MSIRVIKPGRTQFDGFCERCGCEFTYEISDLKLSHSNKVSCPTCGESFYHKNLTRSTLATESPVYKDITWPVTEGLQYKNPCEGCAWHKQLQTQGSYVGDSPCIWCPKGVQSSITNLVAGKPLSLEDCITPCVDLAGTISTGKVSCNCDANAVCSKCFPSPGTITTLSNDIACIHNGDVWKQAGCYCSSSSTSTETAVKASITNAEAKIDALVSGVTSIES